MFETIYKTMRVGNIVYTIKQSVYHPKKRPIRFTIPCIGKANAKMQWLCEHHDWIIRKFNFPFGYGLMGFCQVDNKNIISVTKTCIRRRSHSGVVGDNCNETIEDCLAVRRHIWSESGWVAKKFVHYVPLDS